MEFQDQALIVFQELKGKPISELCIEHQISQAQYYQWHDQFLANASKTFDIHQQTQREARLKKMVGELVMELKKAKKYSDEAPDFQQRGCAQRRIPPAHPGPQN